MSIRTDLAAELRQAVGNSEGIDHQVINFGTILIERTHILNDEGARKIGKPKGTYITISFDGFTPDDTESDLHLAIKNELSALLGEKRSVLVAGLGNERITPDAFGTLAAEGIFATRHIEKALASKLGLGNLKSVQMITPGVLGQTGIEAAELISAAVKQTRPQAVVVLDALAAGDLKRVGRTIQLSNTGICPGSGVGNSRKEISKKSLGVETIAIGLPTVVDASSFMETISGRGYSDPSVGSMMVTPRDIDTMVKYAAKTVSHAINCALQPNVEKSVLLSLGF